MLIGYQPVDRAWFPAELAGADVLCLASGGGQQGPTLAAAGARVTVFDNSPRQLEQDESVARRDGLALRTVLGDMRDLSAFPDSSFDLVFNPVSNLFVPELAPVWRECFRVLRPGGTLLSGFLNPDVFLFDSEALDQRGELVVRHRLPYSDLTHVPAEERERLYGADAPLEYSHTMTDADRRPARRRLRHRRLRGGAAPLRRHRRLAARLLRHPGGEAVTAGGLTGAVAWLTRLAGQPGARAPAGGKSLAGRTANCDAPPMIDKPGVDERLLAAEVAAAWAVTIVDLVFMPVGLDGHAWAYRVDASDGERYFLKLRRGTFTRAAVLLPGFLRAQASGRSWHPSTCRTVEPVTGSGSTSCCSTRSTTAAACGGAASPTASGASTASSWVACTPSRRAQTSPPSCRSRPTDRTLASGCGPSAGRLRRARPSARSGHRYGAALHRLAETVDELASRVTHARTSSATPTSIPGNLIADDDGPLHVVDWDAPILAPRERDLMFIYSQDFGDHPIDAHRAELFRRGYGPLEPTRPC